MKKTDLFKLMLVFTMVLLGSIWNNTIAQEQKAGPQAGAVGSGSSQQAEEQKLKQRQEEPAKRAAEYAQKQEAEKQAKMAARAKAARPNEVTNQQKSVTSQVPNSGLKSMENAPASTPNAVATNNNEKPNVQQINSDFKAQVSKIVASSTTYAEGKKQIVQLQSKIINNSKLNHDDAMWQDLNSTLANTVEVELQKLQEKVSANSKN